jgi:CDP-paratose 2-epimerase
MKKVLITGVAGLVGSATKKAFENEGYEVIGIDNNVRHTLLGTPPKHGYTMLDICVPSMVDELFNEHIFDVIVHAAAQPSHDYSKDHVLQDFDINARGTVILLEATRKYCPTATFIYVSTDKVYGENMSAENINKWPTAYSVKMLETETRYDIQRTTTEPFRGFKEDLELDFAGARSPFGCSKAAGDMYVQEYGNYFGMKTACFRPGCITGKNHEGAELHGFLAYLAKCIRTGTPYKIFGNGKNVRDQIHADDLAQAFVSFAAKPQVAAVFNMGGGPDRAVSVLEAIELIEKETGQVCNFAFYAPRTGDRLFDVHDVSKFRNDYPEWQYKYSLADIIKDVCEKSL